MALARARLRPSKAISTVVPRAMPSGVTVLSVGGVVRLPAAKRTAGQARDASLLNIVNLESAIEVSCRQLLAAGREFEAEGPVGQFGNAPHFRQVGGAEEFDGAVGRGRRQLAVGRPREPQDRVFVRDQRVLQGAFLFA